MRVVEARVNGLILEHKTQQNIVILREADGQRILPIWIGPGEAQAIRRILSEEAFPRPLTHDLLVIMLDGLKAKITRAIIADLRENTFFASVIVEREGEVLSVDARPSDSIALALRAKAPIYVNEKLLQPAPAEEVASEEGGEPRLLTDEEKAEQLRRYLEKLNPEDFGKFQF
ncbi:MAG: bifunctional nuclease family protein [Candidatus Eisenbacteria bacterium]